MTFVSYAQNFEDVLLWRVFRHLEGGFYIDVGAAHPDTDSVTRAFYDRGWHGVNIEPVPELFARLVASRPRDETIQAALGASAGESTLHVVAGTGLSTLDAALADGLRAGGHDVHETRVPVLTLAEIGRRRAAKPVHFLKIDAEGAEQAILEGADFAACRPWIVLVEATEPGSTTVSHAAWEPILLGADYRFLWFDGLNRFYAAAERHEEIAPHFRVPVCVFDDFLRAADTEWTRRITQAETQAADLLERGMAAEGLIGSAEARAQDAEARARDAERRALSAEPRIEGAEWRADAAERRLQRAEAELPALAAALRLAREDAASLRASTSWKLTAPLRNAAEAAGSLRRKRADGPAVADARAPQIAVVAEAPVAAPERTRPVAPGQNLLRSVHQFHSGSAVGDAITNSMLLIRARLRAMGYRSDIYVEHRDEALAGELILLDALPLHDEYLLILHHSMGYDAFDQILALPARKVLMYHNITPAWLFEGQTVIQDYIALGRRQLAALAGLVTASLADSEYNAVELRSLGFVAPQACTLLFDLDAMRRARPEREDGAPFIVLFVGRVVASKGQLDLLEAFAVFRAGFGRPCRLVLVGRTDGVGKQYAWKLRARAAELGLSDCVTVTGLVDDAALATRYGEADLYVSLSRHEGFGVPLVEAACAGVPVLAWPAGAIPYTLGVADGLLASRNPAEVGAAMLALAGDQERLATLAHDQGEALGRFALPGQLAILEGALARAGAAEAVDSRPATLLEAHLRFIVAGHVNKTYSLAVINRTLARVLEEARPGSVRLAPVEGERTDRLDEVPEGERLEIARLAARPAHESGPVVTISQHYPLHVPQEAGDLLLAYLFWEESRLGRALVERLNAHFAAVLAPSRFVAKALVDSGVRIPVHQVGFAPELAPFFAMPVRAAGEVYSFLHVSSAFPRKGIDVLLRAYRGAFRAGDAVRLVIKAFPNPHNEVAAQIAALRAADADAPAIVLIDEDLDAAAMLTLYREADAMVLPTRGEGFNLPAAEAMAAGLPLIVTGHGGHRDFCDASTARLVAYRLETSRSHLAAPLSLWAEPDVDDLRRAMRGFYDNREGAAAMAGRARLAAAAAFSGDGFAARLRQAAVATLLRQPGFAPRLCVVTSWGVSCGVAEYARMLVAGMAAAGVPVRLSVLSDRRPAGAVEGGVEAVQAWTLGSPSVVEELRGAVAREDATIVLIQHQPGLITWASLGGVIGALASPGRVVAVTLHNTANLLDVSAEERAVALVGLARADRVIVHTLADVQRLQGLRLVDNVVLIPQGAPPALAAGPARGLARNQAVTIGCCGFLLPGKGLVALVQAAALLRPRWPKLRLLMMNASYGGEESAREEALVREAIAAGGLERAVELATEFQPFDEARRRLAAADLVVLPYPQSKEASSAALRMALSTGRPVAVTPIPLFEDAGDAVFRLAGVTPEAIAAGIERLLLDREARAALEVSARSWLEERDWGTIGARTLGMLVGLKESAAE